MTSVAADASQAQNSAKKQQSNSQSASTQNQSAPSAAAAGRSYIGVANIDNDRKSLGQSHVKSTSISPAVPSIGTSATANGNAALGHNTGAHGNHHHHHGHSRKPSVTISAAGNSGQMPNGGPTVGQTPTGNGIQFGSMNNASQTPVQNNMATPQDNSSLAVNSPNNPRVTSPANSPSPIPQPATASGGKPPQSSLHQSTNSLSFGTFNNGSEDGQRRSSVQGSMTPNMPNAHLRRDSNHSQHDANMGPGAGRGGYPPAGRGRGFNQSYQPQIPHSPNNAFRSLPPNGPRGPGGANMGPPYAGRGGSNYGGPYSPSHRSPALAHAQPVQQHQGQMPMQSPGMPQGYNYGPGYPAQNVKHSKFFSRSTLKGKSVKGLKGGRKKRDQTNLSQSAAAPPSLNLTGQINFPVIFIPPVLAPNSLSPITGNFEQILTKNLQMQSHYDPSQGAYYQPYMQNQMPAMYMPPQNGYIQGQNSPRPHFQQQASGYMAGQYGQPQPMSRQGSHVSDRPGSAIVQQQPPPPMTPSSHQHTPSRGTSSPAPKQSFLPPKKQSAAIKITDPNTGAALKFDKNAPPSATSAPVNAGSSSKVPESTPTPPPRTPSATHHRSDSKAQKTSEEVKNDLRDQIQAKIKDQEAAAQKQREEEEARKRRDEEQAEAARKAGEEEKLAADKKAAQEAEEARLAAERALEAEKQKAEQEAAAQKKIEEEKARNAAAVAAASQKPAAPKTGEDVPRAPEMPAADASDEAWDEYERASEAYEAAKEAAYQKKKAAKKQEEDAKAAEKAAAIDAELKRQEAEAERIEVEKEKKRNDGDQDKANAFAALKKSDNAFRATETSTEELPEHGTALSSGTNTPKSDTASMPPPASRLSQKPKPAALKLETQKQVEAAQPSAALQSLLSARRLTHFNQDLYPSGIASPNPALNTSAKGSFRYDKDFLLQFQKVFTEKPSENWQEKLKETVGDAGDTPGSARGSNRNSMGHRSVSNRGGVPGPVSGFGGGMGNFGGGRTLPPGTSSADRFAASPRPGAGPNPTLRYDSKSGGFGANFPISMPGGRQGSNPVMSPRTGAGGSRRGDRGSKAGGRRNETQDAKSMPLTAGQDIKTLEVSSTGWKASSIGKAPGPPPGGENGYMAPDIVQRKVKASLNKMTPTTFEKIAGQILDIVMQSKKETDGRTLRQVIQLTFEKATDEAHWAEMYAQFCGKMLSAMTPDIRDETLPKDKTGNVVNGSTLFRKYLLNRCQQDFEQGWQSKLPEKPEGGEAALLSDEYYAAAAAKRRGLGLVRFIGELFKLGMLTARIMHMCVQKLVDFEGMPDEAEIESLTSLLKTIGHDLDNDEKGHVVMDVYFGKIDEMVRVPDLPSRLKFMLMDIIDLRKAGWKGKNSALKGPSTIEQVRKEAAEAQQAAEARAAQEQQQRRGGGGGGGRPGAGRGDARNFSGPPPPDFNSNRVGMDDLRRLGRGSNRSQGNQGPMGPTSMFNTRGSNKRISTPGGIFGKGADDSAASSRTATPPMKSDKERREEAEKAAAGSNAFSALAALDSTESNDMAGSPATSPPTTKRPLPGDAARSSDGA